MGRVIHVDNSKFFRKIMRTFLSEIGLESESFENGRDALFAAGNGETSCIITGLELPDMKGEEFIEKVVSLGLSIAIIVFSTDNNEERIDYLESHGVVGIVQKTSNWKEDLRKFFF